LPPEQAARLRDLLPDTDLMVYYGLTEASRSTFISLTSGGPAYYTSVGRAMPGVALRLADDGEVLISGPTVAQGYWNDPTLTSQTLRDGWLHTGDLGRLDADGFLFVTGRKKDLINVGGYKVRPEEVEHVLLGHEAVQDAGVFGQDQVEAAIVASCRLDPADLSRLCYSRLEPFKVPARFHQIDAIPRSDTGKIKRAALAEMLKGT
jgi:long-chain acyl-CoA synthetase